MICNLKLDPFFDKMNILPSGEPKICSTSFTAAKAEFAEKETRLFGLEASTWIFAAIKNAANSLTFAALLQKVPSFSAEFRFFPINTLRNFTFCGMCRKNIKLYGYLPPFCETRQRNSA